MNRRAVELNERGIETGFNIELQKNLLKNINYNLKNSKKRK